MHQPSVKDQDEDDDDEVDKTIVSPSNAPNCFDDDDSDSDNDDYIIPTN